MKQKLTMKKINTWRQQLQEILRMDKKQDELVPKGQKKRLKKLAQEVGASTRGIGYHSDGRPYGYPASIAELIDNINQALQTTTSIKNSEYTRQSVYATRRSVYITIVAVAVSIAALVASIYFSAKNVSVAQEANRLNSTSLKNSYIPWLQVTSVKASLLDSNRVEIVHGCQNYTNAPALDLYIKYTISDSVSMVGESPTYISNPLMPNYEGNFNCIFTSLNQANRLIEKLNSGESSVRFDIYFKDVFGHSIVVHQETKRIDGKFRITSYKVDGIDNLFEEIE